MRKTCQVLLTIPYCLFPLTLFANNTNDGDHTATEKSLIASQIVVQSNPIFDESAPNSFFIHRWANFLHINTKESTIIDNLSFEQGDKLTEKDIQEAQRLLRAEAYIRDAKITALSVDPDADAEYAQSILVETWDNWSLLPTFSLSKSGGETKYSVGIKEDNLLGLGISTRIRYQSNADRTGYKFAFSAPVKLIKHATISADFYDNSDGQASSFAFDKPFYALNTQHMYGAAWLQDKRTDTLRQNGLDINEFEHQINYAKLSFGWLINKKQDELSRLTFGITQDEHQFANLASMPDSELPQDREFIYPWVGYEYLQDDFTVLNNIYLIGNNEDFNLGWHHKIKLGFETNDLAEDADIGYHIDLSSSRGWRADDHLFLFKFAAEADLATSQADFYNVSASAEYFYHITDKWTTYTKVWLATSDNNYLDRTFALGDETGIRGYPNNYQHGDHQWVFTAELRNYPNINLYQLAELGWAVFTDIGQAFGGTDDLNELNAPLGSVGIGARIYSSKSSYGNVAHIDIAKPFTNGADVNDWEFRFQIKDHF
ncbi:ShlB/FhaC/HecB family hemolysin secretion/activation protein [Shewanella gaetbuli]